MNNNLERFKGDLAKLNKLGSDMYNDLIFQMMEKRETLKGKYTEAAEKVKGSFRDNYQRWYTEACAVLRQLVPDRLEEFVHLYHGDGRRKEIDDETYHIQNWLNRVGVPVDYVNRPLFDSMHVIMMRFDTQRQILNSAGARFESSLLDMVQLVRADVFDSELDAARELTKNGFLRGAGAITGVVIEKHLALVCVNHNVTVKKKEPTINDFNEALKAASVLDVPAWRQIQRLGDIRNLCDHNKQREPTKEEVIELIEGAEKLCKTLF